MIKYNSQKEKDKQNKICRDKITASIISEAERKKAYEQKMQKVDENSKRLLAYVAEIRATYSGDALVYLEERVIKRWAAIKYRRDASLAHHDVENALHTFYCL